LAEGFVEDEGGAVGEVEGAGGGVEHGDVEGGVGVLAEEPAREAGGFAAEDEVIAGLKGGGGVGARAVGLDQPEPWVGGELGGEGWPIGPAPPIELLPVIHAGAFELAIIEFEAKGFDEVEGGAGGGAKAGDVAGVGWDLGLKKDQVEVGGFAGAGLVCLEGRLRFHGRARAFLKVSGWREKATSMRLVSPVASGVRADYIRGRF
jgi:hypothetical protein